jgi:hypothetical protein
MRGRRTLGWIALAIGTVFASMPLWRPLLFPGPLTIDEVLAFRCG